MTLKEWLIKAKFTLLNTKEPTKEIRVANLTLRRNG